MSDFHITIPFELKGHDLSIAAETIGIGMTTARALIKSGALPSYRVGRRVLVRGDSILAYQAKQMECQS